ncbi:MAG TPA: hypothetical protein PLL30_13695 [Candidatus Krumholzibacteria bacterium]|nr:hypothetical protein [Candidatus Krumholzibacteria bacterium]HPD72818.1 hypothetical protein [Candidatus Krumholzibacteria bacterium]HRY40250.1 hypothetical protein [Candidatus Krumholzibacteria bacterium]
MSRTLGLRIAAGLAILAGLGGTAAAKTTWVSVKDLAGGPAVCLETGGERLDYTLVGDAAAVHCSVQGPRRLKLTSRYLFAADDSSRVAYAMIVQLDGREVLRKGFTGTVAANFDRCDADGRVGTLRRSYLDLPAGKHDLTIRAECEGMGSVAIRLFRQVKRQRDHWVAFAPEHYGEIRHLQFANGNESAYYHFDADTPLGLTVSGPTTLRVATRLDFDHLMNGGQTYALQVAIDGTVWRTFHFDSDRLASALYVERPDILPGERKELTIAVPRGRHAVEIRCVRPETCGVAALIHLPLSDLER